MSAAAAILTADAAVASLSDAVPAYCAWLAASGYAVETVKTRKSALRLFRAWAEPRGVWRLDAVTLPLLDAYRQAVSGVRRVNGRPLGWGAQVQRLLAVKRLLAWAVRGRLLSANPAAELEFPRRPRQLPRAVLSALEAERVMRRPDVVTPLGLRDRAMLEMLYSTGIRRAELAGLALPDVDFLRGTIWVREGKGKRDRVIPIGARALSWVDKYLRCGRPLLVRSTEPPHLFLSARGRPVAKNRLTELVGRYLAAAGLEGRGACHLFRHTMATLMLEGGADIRYIQAMLGHARLSTTEIYTHVAVHQLKAVHARTHPAERGRGRPRHVPGRMAVDKAGW